MHGLKYQTGHIVGLFALAPPSRNIINFKNPAYIILYFEYDHHISITGATEMIRFFLGLIVDTSILSDLSAEFEGSLDFVGFLVLLGAVIVSELCP